MNISLKEITDRINTLTKPFAQLLKSRPSPVQLMENGNIIKSIALNRQCERFLHDLLNALADQQVYVERYLKNFRNQLNKIHEIVKFRTAIPISSIFVSTPRNNNNNRNHDLYATYTNTPAMHACTHERTLLHLCAQQNKVVCACDNAGQTRFPLLAHQHSATVFGD